MPPEVAGNATFFYTFGSFTPIVNAATGKSSTGIVAAHMALIPPAPGANTAVALQQERALVWSRHVNPNWEAANGGGQPGMAGSTVAVFNAVTGTYTSAPMAQNGAPTASRLYARTLPAFACSEVQSVRRFAPMHI